MNGRHTEACTNCKRIKPIAAHGLCSACYGRWRRNGTVDYQHKFGRARCRHPLYQSWTFLRRKRGIQFVVAEWQEDFFRFAGDVGERPSKKHKLFIADETKPMGPDNFIWKRSITERIDG